MTPPVAIQTFFGGQCRAFPPLITFLSRRLLLAFPLLACIALPSTSARCSETLDAIIMRIERVHEAYAAMTKYVDVIGAEAAPHRGAEKPEPETLKSVQQEIAGAAVAAFDPDSAMKTIASRLAAVPGGTTDLTALAAAADAYEDGFGKRLSSGVSESEEAVNKRDDREDLRRLVLAMAYHALVSERGVTEARVRNLFRFRFLADLKSFHAADDEHFVKFTEEFVRRARDDERSVADRESGTKFWREQMLGVLVRLSPEHLKTLESFYATEVWAEKRKVLVAAFAEQSDADALKMYRVYLGRLRKE